YTVEFEDETTFGPDPNISLSHDVLNVVDGLIVRGSPSKMLLTNRASALEDPPPDFELITYAERYAGSYGTAWSPINTYGAQQGDLVVSISNRSAFAQWQPQQGTPSINVSIPNPSGWAIAVNHSLTGGATLSHGVQQRWANNV